MDGRSNSKRAMESGGISRLPLGQINRHTMPSHFRAKSLKTHDGGMWEVSHFFVVAFVERARIFAIKPAEKSRQSRPLPGRSSTGTQRTREAAATKPRGIQEPHPRTSRMGHSERQRPYAGETPFGSAPFLCQGKQNKPALQEATAETNARHPSKGYCVWGCWKLGLTSSMRQTGPSEVSGPSDPTKLGASPPTTQN